jgi:glycosyltransferase involved in cell wall biosynthesis
MHIAILTSSYPRFLGDGTAPFVQSIAEAMVKLGHLVEVVAPYDLEVKPISPNGVKIHRFRYSLIKKLHIMGHGRSLESDVRLRPLAVLLLPFYLLAAFITLWRVTGRQKSDAIYAHWVIPNGPVAVLVAKIRRIPFIVSLHGSDIFLAYKNRLFGYVAHWVFIHASGVTACSPEIKEQAIELGAPKSTELLAWGADPRVFRPADDRMELRHKLGWSDAIVITTLGRLVYKKGFDILIKALPDVIVNYPNLQVIIGGDGSLLGELKELTKSLGIENSVQFIGRVPWTEVPELLAAANIFVLPSIRDASGNLDGLPTVLLEAMGCGSAIIASDIGGVSLAIRNKENGILVAPGSVNELKQALLVLLGDQTLRNKLGKSARKTIEDDLNWENVAWRIGKLLYISVSAKTHKRRVGTVYRDAMLARLGLLEPSEGRVLDAGCYDGFLLSRVNAEFRVGIDLNPVQGTQNIHLVKADARYLPFYAGCFDRVYALDVIEHIEDDIAFSNSLASVLSVKGKLILTTTSADIRLNPSFLTNWISRKWGHIYRLGYSPNRLMELFGSNLDINVRSWNAPAYRFCYPFSYILQLFLPRVIDKWVNVICDWDFQRQKGKNGFQIMIASAKNINSKTEVNQIL